MRHRVEVAWVWLAPVKARAAIVSAGASLEVVVGSVVVVVGG
jgi:hypothetical protein